ncbi:hypothetical protein HN385_02155 [archaeon]|jgi:hypothetical protein|nr:hypothetical protein [archaeon]MBT3450357.1 hypothetical protein [archaeon]MBT6868868.1 hypothetical protein [archaeon]MBT7192911.1 hypothetical protein [archaeon]MBT7380877.1 hypothetical protein [archaeon]
MVLGSLMGLIGLISFIWIVYDVLVNQKRMKTTHKVLWVVLGFFFSIITAIVYYFMFKSKCCKR